ncbi:unnamed protein product, partial [Sphenostylis stenocarpa]
RADASFLKGESAPNIRLDPLPCSSVSELPNEDVDCVVDECASVQCLCCVRKA